MDLNQQLFSSLPSVIKYMVWDFLFSAFYKCIKTIPRSHRMRPLSNANGHNRAISSIVLFGDRFITGSLDGTIKIWTIDGECINTLKHIYIHSILIHGERIISSSGHTIQIWTFDGELIKTLRGHTYDVNSIAIFNNQIISGSWDGTIKIWTLEGQCIKTLRFLFQEGDKRIGSIAIHENKIVFSHYKHPIIKIITLDGKIVKTLEGHSKLISCIGTHGNKIISGSEDKTIKIWIMDVDKNRVIHRDGIICDLHMEDEFRGKCVKTLVGHSQGVTCIKIYGDLIISGSWDGTIKIWTLEGRCLKTLNIQSPYITSIALYGDRIISGSANGIIKIWKSYSLFY